jgi:hypothetical protein
MSPRAAKPKSIVKPILKHPWPIVTGSLIGLLLVLTLFFLFFGISPEIDSHMVGNIGISMETNSAGQVVLYPMPGYDAEKAGVQNFDILLDINGQPISQTTDIKKQLNGRVGESLTITVRKSDGSEKTYKLARSSTAQIVLSQAGLSIGILTGYLLSLSMLVGLGFAALGAFLLLRRPAHKMFILTACVLVLLPYSLNSLSADSVMVQGAIRLNLGLLYNLLRVAGLGLASLLVYIFPDVQFLPKWIRWGMIGVGVWAVLYAIALINPAFLPGSWIDLVWMVIIAIGLGLQSYRYQHSSSGKERHQIRLMGLILLVAIAVYIVLWLVELFLPGNFMVGAGGVWFTLISDLLEDAAFLYFGVSLMLSTRKSD